MCVFACVHTIHICDVCVIEFFYSYNQVFHIVDVEAIVLCSIFVIRCQITGRLC